MRIDVKFDDVQVQAALQRLISAGADQTPAMRAIAGILDRATERAFAEQRDPATGEPWAELSEVTKQRREKSGHWPGSILQVTGSLARDMERDYGPNFALVGTNKPYAPTQHFGAEKGEFGSFSIVSTRRQVLLPWGDIPARPIFGIGLDDEHEILDVLAGFLERQIRG